MSLRLTKEHEPRTLDKVRDENIPPLEKGGKGGFKEQVPYFMIHKISPNPSLLKRGIFVNDIFRIYLFALLLSLTATACYAGDNTTVAVTATVLSKSNCKFSPPGTAALNFGNLDPANPVDKNASTSIIFRCRGSAPMATFFISDDDGLYESGPTPNRMRHTTITTEYLPYSFTLSPTSGTVPKNTNQTLTISGTVKGTDYQDASVGAYSDTVTISIVP